MDASFNSTFHSSTFHNSTSPSSKRSQSPQFLVPRFENSQKRCRRGPPDTGLPEVPNVSRSMSPGLNIANGLNWARVQSQAVAASQRHSYLPLSSQLSFSDSLTDESENVNEFDLLFEKSPKHNGGSPRQNGGGARKQNGGSNEAFHNYFNDVLEGILPVDFDQCGKVISIN